MKHVLLDIQLTDFTQTVPHVISYQTNQIKIIYQ